jgi:hypothetical protein
LNRKRSKVETYLIEKGVNCLVYHSVGALAQFLEQSEPGVALLLLLGHGFLLIDLLVVLQTLINMAVRTMARLVDCQLAVAAVVV